VQWRRLLALISVIEIGRLEERLDALEAKVC
jgi:hypothetical protein